MKWCNNEKSTESADSDACIYFTMNTKGQYFWNDASCSSGSYKIICQIEDQGL